MQMKRCTSISMLAYEGVGEDEEKGKEGQRNEGSMPEDSDTLQCKYIHFLQIDL